MVKALYLDDNVVVKLELYDFFEAGKIADLDEVWSCQLLVAYF